MTDNFSDHRPELSSFTLKNVNDQKQRDELLKKAFEKLKGLTILEHILVAEHNRRGRNDELLLSDADFMECKKWDSPFFRLKMRRLLHAKQSCKRK